MSRGEPAAGVTGFGGCWAGAGGFESRSDPEVPHVLEGLQEGRALRTQGAAQPPLRSSPSCSLQSPRFPGRPCNGKTSFLPP